MQVQIKTKNFKKFLKRLDPKKVDKIIQQSLNRAAKSTKTKASTIIRKEKGFRIRKRDVDKKIVVVKTTGNRHRVVIYAKTGGKRANSFPLTDFGAKEVKQLKGSVKTLNKRTTKAGITGLQAKIGKRSRLTGGVWVQVRRNGPKVFYPDSFIAQMKSGHIGVFRIKEDGSLEERRVISIFTMFRGILKPLSMHGRLTFRKEVVRRIRKDPKAGL